MNPIANRTTRDSSDLPFLFPDAAVVDPELLRVSSCSTSVSPPIWDGTRMLLPPSFSWGNRVANTPPNIGFPAQNIDGTHDISVSLTKVTGRHTLKSRFLQHPQLQAADQGGGACGPLSFQQDAVGTNPFDTSFGFANAAIGCFSSYSQGSKTVEGEYVYNNTEGYLQDNWKLSDRLTVDYGVRFVHQQPQYDKRLQASNFFVEDWTSSQAPVLYVAGCLNGVYPCSGTNRQAMNPVTKQLLGPNTTLAIGTVVPNSGNLTNGLKQAGQGIPDTTYTWPSLASRRVSGWPTI